MESGDTFEFVFLRGECTAEIEAEATGCADNEDGSELGHVWPCDDLGSIVFTFEKTTVKFFYTISSEDIMSSGRSYNVLIDIFQRSGQPVPGLVNWLVVELIYVW